MKTLIAALAALTIIASLAPARAADGGRMIYLQGDYVHREGPLGADTFARASVHLDQGRWWNPRGGVEVMDREGQLRCYWFGNDFIFPDHHRVSIRLNHTEYPDWETAINFATFYYSYHRAWFHASVGLGYAALVFEEENWHSPVQYNTGAPESRFIYNLSARPGFFDKRLLVDIGLRNFDNFEYRGFDQTGYHIQPIFYLRDDLAVSLYYERLYSGAFISIPTLTRIAWIGSIEYRF